MLTGMNAAGKEDVCSDSAEGKGIDEAHLSLFAMPIHAVELE